MDKRRQEFIQYHIKGDGECNGIVLKEYCDRKNMNLQQRYEVAYFYSITYCVESAIYIYIQQEEIKKDIDYWVEKNKEKIIFQSDRKYVKYLDRFNTLLKQFFVKIFKAETINDKLLNKNKINLKMALNCLKDWYYFSRFSSFLFIETYSILSGYEIDNTEFDWKNGDTATSGMLNLLGADKQADYFDRTGKLPTEITTQELDKQLKLLIKDISNANGDTKLTDIETSLCAYRKFYKGTRYNGYYLDRQLQEILEYKRVLPNISEELLEIRKSKFDNKLLGEIQGWSRNKKRKKKRLYKLWSYNMVKLQEHLDKILETKVKISNSKGQQRKQFIRHLHKLQKQLKQCKIYLKEGGKVI